MRCVCTPRTEQEGVGWWPHYNGQERQEGERQHALQRQTLQKHSIIWMHFNYIDNTKAEFRLCKVKISYQAGSTSNLHRHMRTVHPTVKLAEKRQASEPTTNRSASVSAATVAAAPASTASSCAPPQPPRSTTQSSMSQFMQKTMTPARQNTVDEELASMTARDFQPFSIVDDTGFRSYTHALNPMYVIPCRKTLSQKNYPKTV